MNALQNKAMLVRLTVHAWTARKKDKDASREVEKNHNAKDSGNYIKLLIDKSHLTPYQQQEGKIREYYSRMTLPWSDAGDRLLPAAAFMDFTTGMRERIDEADRLANDFVLSYPTMVADARTKLGTMYNALDYPAESTIRERFGVELEFNAVPDAKDFRVDVGEEAAAQIKDTITKSVENKQKEATRACWQRLQEAVGKIVEVMERDKPRIFDSLMEAPRELIVILPKLNFSGDIHLDALCIEIGDRLIVESDELRRDAGLRMEIGRRAADVLGKIEGFMND